MGTVYNKSPLSFEEQLTLLQTRGLLIDDEARAISYLKAISYYRLSAYFLPYQKEKDKFDQGTSFDLIIKTYTFDRGLRLLVFDIIERLEVAIRTQFIYILANKYKDSHWQDNPRLFIAPTVNKYGYSFDPYKDLQNIISKESRN